MNRFTPIATMLALAAPLALAEQAAPTADLSPGLVMGQTGQWVITRSFTEDSKAIVAETTSTLNATFECSTEVRSVRGEGGSVVQVTFTRIIADGSGDEWTGSYDSADPAPKDATERDDFDRAFDTVAGRTVDLVLDSFGTIIDARGLSDLQNRDPVAATLAEAVLGIDALDRCFGPILAIKPEAPFVIPVGESYEDTCDAMLSVGRVLTRVQLTLEDVKKSTATLALGGRTQLFGNTHTDVSPKITEQEITGSAAWDTARHALMAYDLSIDWTLEAGGTQLPIRIARTETIAIKPAH